MQLREVYNMGYLQTKKRALMNTVAKGGRLPSEYQEVEWIGGTGFQNLLIHSAPLKADYIITEIACEFITNDEYLISGYTWNTGDNRFGIGGKFAYNGYTNFHFAFGNNPTDEPPYMLTAYDNDFHIWTYENGVFEIVDKSEIVNVSSRIYRDDNRRKIQIFKGFATSLSGKIKYFIQERNGEQILNLIPCYRKSDDVIGMYDTVTQTFYINAGTGTFLKGADV